MTDSDQGGGSSSSSSSIFPAGDVSAGGSEGNSTSGNMTPLSTPRSSCDPRNCREETGLGGGATAGRSSTSLSPSYLQQRRGSCSKSGAQTREPVAMPLRSLFELHWCMCAWCLNFGAEESFYYCCWMHALIDSASRTITNVHMSTTRWLRTTQ